MHNNEGTTGFTCGAFDLLHPGHLHLLSAAASQCDYLWVGLHTDPSIDRPEKNKPLQTMFERYMQLNALADVDNIIPYDTENDLLNLLAILDIDKRFIGSDYEDQTITGATICEKRGIEVIYVPRLHNWSSTELRHRVKNQ
jgi:glycerol-3-phosphate cytidylyltransferase